MVCRVQSRTEAYQTEYFRSQRYVGFEWKEKEEVIYQFVAVAFLTIVFCGILHCAFQFVLEIAGRIFDMNYYDDEA